MTTGSNYDQYQKWIYPSPVQDIAEAVSNGWIDFGDPKLIWPLYWPDLPSTKKIKILIAGCGAHQAAYYAYTNPNCDIFGFDISGSAIQHHEFLKSKHNLYNLDVKQCSLENYSAEHKFDLIICTGVLHHLENPLSGLCILKKHLAEKGKINLMVYGKYPRIGVYMMQQVFGLLQLQQTNEDLKTVKDILQLLPNWHHVSDFVQKSPDMKFDAGIVDIFLHRTDRAYTVDEVFALINDADLEFIDWTDRLHYSINALIPTSHYLYSHVSNLNLQQRATFVELICQTIATHRCILGHPHSQKRMSLSSSSASVMCPLIRHGAQITQGKLTRSHAAHELTVDQQQILNLVDGKNTASNISKITQIPLATVIDFLTFLDEAGHILYSY